MQKNLGNTDTLFHAAREGSDFVMLFFEHVDLFQNLCDPVFTILLIRNIFEYRLIMEKLIGTHIFISAEFLRQITDQSLKFLTLFERIDSVDPDTAVCLFQNAADDTHQCGLACTVGAEKPEHAGANFKSGPVQCTKRCSLAPDHRDDQHKLVEEPADIRKSAGQPVDVDLLMMNVLSGDIYREGQHPQNTHSENCRNILPAQEKTKQTDERKSPENKFLTVCGG